MGLNNLDDKLEKYIDFKNGFFVEAGGNDDITQSNTYYLEKHKNWKGILVEGIPELYEKCKNNRKNSIVCNNALVSKEFEAKTIEMESANLMSVVSETIFDKEEYIQEGLRCQNLSKTYRISVPVCTLQEILEKNEIKKLIFYR